MAPYKIIMLSNDVRDTCYVTAFSECFNGLARVKNTIYVKRYLYSQQKCYL